MPDLSYEEARKRELQAIVNNIRYECQDLVDEYWVAFWFSGRPMSEWDDLQRFEHEWFRVLNREKLTFEEARGALKVVRAYLQSQIETLKLEAMERSDKRHA